MKLVRPLIARKKDLTATVHIKKDKLVLSMAFNHDFKNASEHTFKEEETLFAYLEKFEVLPEHFKLSPF